MDQDIEAVILDLCRERGTARSICPSEVARRLASSEGDWRALMPKVREVARALRQAGIIEVTQKSVAVDPVTARGPIRLRLRPSDQI